MRSGNARGPGGTFREGRPSSSPGTARPASPSCACTTCCGAADLSGWTPNARIRDAGGRIIARADVLFAAQRVVIEVDGRAYHGADRFQADRDRDNALVAAGYVVLRFTWLDLTERPARTLERIRAALRRADA